MQNYYKLFFISFNIFYQFSTTSSNHQPVKESLLLVVSFDGMRYDYIDRYANKNGFLNKLRMAGTRARIKPIFPTNTYPNHWSIVTGVHPETHGIINNNVFNPKTKDYYRVFVDKEEKPGWFDTIEPIWITNQRHRKSSVVIDWPGSTAQFGVNDVNYLTTRHATSKNYRIGTYNKTIDYFVDKLSFENTSLALLYFSEPDVTAHHFGPDSFEVNYLIKEFDYILNYLFDQLKRVKRFSLMNERNDHGIYRPINLILLTDHGMDSIRFRESVLMSKIGRLDPNRHVFLSDYFDVHKYLDIEKCSCGSFAELWPLKNDESFVNELYEQLIGAKKFNNKISQVYLKKDIPERFHIKFSVRTAPIVLLASPRFQIFLDRSRINSYTYNNFYGNHGFDNELEEMYGNFMALGDAFKTEYTTNKSINLIDVYEMMCYLLKIKPNDNNGSLDNIKHLLNKKYMESLILMKVIRDDEVIVDQNSFKQANILGKKVICVLMSLISIYIFWPYIIRLAMSFNVFIHLLILPMIHGKKFNKPHGTN